MCTKDEAMELDQSKDKQIQDRGDDDAMQVDEGGQTQDPNHKMANSGGTGMKPSISCRSGLSNNSASGWCLCYFYSLRGEK